jgi:uncharacterized protein HemY
VYLWLFVPQVFWFWWNAIGTLVTVLVAIIISLMLPQGKGHFVGADKMRWKSKESIVLLIFFVIIVVISVLLPYII